MNRWLMERHLLPIETVVVDSLLDDEMFSLRPVKRSKTIFAPQASEYEQEVSERQIFKGICEFGTDNNLSMVLIAEKARSMEWKKYVADIVLDIEWSTRRDDFKRTFIVRKARYQPSLPGQHELTIKSCSGVNILVAKSELFSTATEVAKSPNARTEKFSSDENLNDFVHDILEGSSILIAGQDKTQKYAIASRFLEQLDPRTNERGLMIALGMTAESGWNTLSTYSLRDSLVKRIDVLPIQTDGGKDLQILNDLVRLLRDESLSYSRVAVIDLSSIAANDSLRYGIKAVLSESKNTCLYVETISNPEVIQDRTGFDTVILTRYLKVGGRHDVVGFQIARRNGITPPERGRSYAELREIRKSEPMRLEFSLNDFQITSAGELFVVPCSLRLYCPFESGRDYWRSQIVQ